MFLHNKSPIFAIFERTMFLLRFSIFHKIFTCIFMFFRIKQLFPSALFIFVFILYRHGLNKPTNAAHIVINTPMSRIQKVLVLMASFYSLCICFGIAFNMSVLNNEWLEYFQKTKAETSLIQSTTMAMLNLGGNTEYIDKYIYVWLYIFTIYRHWPKIELFFWCPCNMLPVEVSKPNCVSSSLPVDRIY